MEFPKDDHIMPPEELVAPRRNACVGQDRWLYFANEKILC